MARRTASAVIIAMLLTGISALAFNVQTVKSDYVWTETIYIRADGSIQPPAAPISSVDNVTYTLTDNIAGNVLGGSSAIIIQRDNVIVDGAGYTLQGTQGSDSKGIELTGRSNVTIKNMEITAFYHGIWLNLSSSNILSGNNITANNGNGIALESSSNNTVSGNNMTANSAYGIWLSYSSSNTISGNNVTNNYYGIGLDHSSDNTLAGNIMTKNAYNFLIEGFALSDYVNDVDTSNTVDGKPVYYWVNRQDMTVPLNAGTVVLANCTRITVQNLNLARDWSGVLLAYTTNSTITQNNSTTINAYGIWLFSSSNNTVSGNNAANNGNGIGLSYSSNNTISGNNITSNYYGIGLYSSSNNTVSGNNAANNAYGIGLTYSSNDTVSGNNITANNGNGIALESSSNNTIYHNNFINNTSQVSSSNSTNVWDDDYPSGGNYWSDYNGTDGSGDGVGDTPYVVDANNTDRYPLMAPYSMFDAGTWNGTTCSIGVMSNSTVSAFKVDVTQKTVSFNVTGTEGSAGFCRVTIPTIIAHNMWQSNYTVLVDGNPWPFTNWTDTTNTYVYFNYTQSQHQTVIIPEFPSLLILPILMIMTLLATIASRRKWPKHQTGSRQRLRTAGNK